MKHYGLVGRTLRHSKSKLLHNIIYRHAHIDADYQYIEIENITELENATSSLDGFNITIPYKETILTSYSCEKHTALNAINTIYKHNGTLEGYNTDIDGFLETLKRNQVPLDLPVSILGYGGAALAVIEALKQYGYNEIIVYSRRILKSEDSMLTFKTYEHFKPDNKGILIHTTPLGTTPNLDTVLPPELLAGFSIYIDLVYNPQITPFLAIGRKAGKPVINGLEMLVFQAIRAVEIWEKTIITNDQREAILKEFIDVCD